ncbi:AcrR family transcriptional regulator [Stenotrophomonas chelatiphaga]|jgi:AcrR family transcriptional regulator|uniref:AcrR family transcriptional regulator n=1 Tax=Stenotrophomonas chelatiphaga TaxID=517011 RepID=A0A0R0D0R3_9GAMM|nr:TetR/AcrR family transcriptional regulator [Stenotrophomonas chelatiphaga]KRG75724.1 AcrR family transcriptional regulator [Stenotrophomonas chelatiphaga]MCS4231820.1 AcrR family transcriptional regulator [Stenotrophomonas chelatiphaga]ROQ41743.1 TetR family transcriptional regulator [Stenotrophomonas maltophilia]
MAYKRSPLMEERMAGARERILLAARELVAAGGYRNAPVTAVAAQAGVSTGLIYRHFPSKAELFVEVLSAAVEHEVEILEGIAAGSEPAPQRLRLAITAFVRRALAGPGLAHAFIVEPVDPEVEAERMRGRRRFGDVFRRLVEDGIASGAFPAQDVDVTAACIVGAFTEALVGPTAPSRQAHRDEHALADSISAFCLRAAGG